jgi:hypothetical protein
MPIFRRNPTEVEGRQWTGDNLFEMQIFVGYRPGYEGRPVPAFTPIGTYIPDFNHPKDNAELWVAANKGLMVIEKGEWVLQDELGCYPCKDEQLQKNYTKVMD